MTDTVIDSVVRDETARANARVAYSDFELDVMGDIIAWAMFSSMEFADTKEMVTAFWKEKLNVE